MMLRLILVIAALIPGGMAAAQNRGAIAQPTTPESRLALADAAACLVEKSPEEAVALLKMDFRKPVYATKMNRLFANNDRCIRARWMRANRLLVAGDVAERLLARNAEPVNVRLMKRDPSVALTPRSPTDGVALCVARSDPDGVGKLFATPVASDAEIAAAQALNVALGRCNQTGKAISTSAAGLRAMVATATFRLLEGQDS